MDASTNSIERLGQEAGEAGDLVTARLCRRALLGYEGSRAIVEATIREHAGERAGRMRPEAGAQ